MSAARATTDHETIRQWVEERGGHPARVIGTESEAAEATR
jgi:transposase-like protein